MHFSCAPWSLLSLTALVSAPCQCLDSNCCYETSIVQLTVLSAFLQTDRGLQQAQDAGEKIKRMMESDGHPYRLYFYM